VLRTPSHPNKNETGPRSGRRDGRGRKLEPSGRDEQLTMADVEAGCGRLLQKLKPDESVQG
jgi:hypothetical protein